MPKVDEKKCEQLPKLFAHLLLTKLSLLLIALTPHADGLWNHLDCATHEGVAKTRALNNSMLAKSGEFPLRLCGTYCEPMSPLSADIVVCLCIVPNLKCQTTCECAQQRHNGSTKHAICVRESIGFSPQLVRRNKPLVGDSERFSLFFSTS